MLEDRVERSWQRLVFTGSNRHGADELHPVTDQEDKGNKKLHIMLHRDLYFEYKKLDKTERKRKPSWSYKRRE